VERGDLATRPAPVQRVERIATLDALRGFALFGIFVVNLSVFSLYDFVSPAQRGALPLAEYDRLARFVIELLFHGKFYALFSLLFGIGFAIQLERAADRGRSFLGVYTRRLAILLAIGLAHMMLLWAGDILALYALLGFVLIAFRRFPPWLLLALAVGLLLLPVAQAWLQAAHGFDPAGPIEEWARRAAALGQRGRSDAYRRFAQLVSEGREFKVMGMFLVGLWIGRRRILHDPAAHRRLLAWTVALGVPLGLAGGAAMGAIELRLPAAEGIGPVGAAALYAAGVFPLALAYAAGGALLGLRAAGRRVLSLFAPAGRMALTNYLLQSVIGTEVFYATGMGYGGTVGPLGWIAFAIVVFAAQVLASAIWLSVFRYGPVEWLWRQLTYLRPLSILRWGEPR
jgi:uncharacterized protein